MSEIPEIREPYAQLLRDYIQAREDAAVKRRLIDADELLGLLNYLEASSPIIEWQSQREAEARKRALWQVRAWVESRVDPESVVAA